MDRGVDCRAKIIRLVRQSKIAYNRDTDAATNPNGFAACNQRRFGGHDAPKERGLFLRGVTTQIKFEFLAGWTARRGIEQSCAGCASNYLFWAKDRLRERKLAWEE